MNEIIKIENLVKKFPVGSGFFTALNNINLSFGTGEFTGLIGPSGSGKTYAQRIGCIAKQTHWLHFSDFQLITGVYRVRKC